MRSCFSLQYGAHVGAGHFEGSAPTYIFPEALKAVIRARFPDELTAEESPDPTGSSVHVHLYIYIRV